MVNLVMQSTILSLSKSGKFSKSLSSLNTPLAEEEENRSEKEFGGDLILFSENGFSVSELQPCINLVWPQTEEDCLFHTSEILVPPPKI
jgi:hypothetical protein